MKKSQHARVRSTRKAISISKASFVIRPRLDRFFPLRDAFGYAGSDYYDILLWIPRADAEEQARELRIWLRTVAARPMLEITGSRFVPRARSARDRCWLDLGVISQNAPEFGVNGFARLRVYGLSPAQAQDACVVFTLQTDVEPAGDIPAVERALTGISRLDVGQTFITPRRVTVGSPAEFKLLYEAGPRGLPPSALVRLSFPLAFSRPQTTNPRGPGWLRTSWSDAIGMRLVGIERSIESHTSVDAVYLLPKGLLPGGRIRWQYNTKFTYLFPMRWEETDRRYWWSHLPVMALAVAVNELQIFMPPLKEYGHAVEFVAGPPERLHLFLPGRVRDAKGRMLSGVFTDRYRNSPSQGPLERNVKLRLVRAPARGTGVSRTVSLGPVVGHFDRWYRFCMRMPRVAVGVYRAEAVERVTGRVLARSNPMEVMAGGDKHMPIYWGEIHGHSEQSDGSGPYENIFIHARDEGRLDFAAAADHACYFTDNEWEWMQDMTNSFNRPGRFVTLLGYEWAGDQGHRNVYGAGRRLELCRGMDLAARDFKTVNRIFRGRMDVVVGPHVHHGGPGFMTSYDPDLQRFFEIHSMWGNYEHLAFELLNKGVRIGLTGGGDDHEARVGFSVEDPKGQGTVTHTFAPGLRFKCGMTAALMPRLRRTDLLRCLRERSTYATTGARILVDFRVGASEMGGECIVRGSHVRVKATVHACAPIARVDLVRDGNVVYSVPSKGTDHSFVLPAVPVPTGNHWLLLRVTQTDGEIAWTSPVWCTAR